jgi:hypothetical protein
MKEITPSACAICGSEKIWSVGYGFGEGIELYHCDEHRKEVMELVEELTPLLT